MTAALGPLAAFAALLVWGVGLPLGWLDALVAALFAAGLALSALSWRGRHSQWSVIGLGLNAAGLAILLILYAAG